MHDKQSGRLGRHSLLTSISSILLFSLLSGAVHAQPANDDCDSAAPIPGTAPFPPFTTSVDATDATLDPADPTLSCNDTGNDDGDQTVWWEYTPAATGTVMITTIGSETSGGGELDTAHGAFTGNCGALVEVACVDQGLNDYLVMDVEAGTTYKIKVGQYQGGNDAGTVVLNVEEPAFLPGLKVIESVRDNISDPITDIVAAAPASFSANKSDSLNRNFFMEVPNFNREDGMSAGPDSNGSLVDVKGPIQYTEAADLLQIFEGSDNLDNAFTYGFILAPPDTVGAVGTSHYVQMTNLLTRIYDKSGNTVLGPIPTSTFFTGLGGNCEISDDGDPIVLYDEETDRWLVSQFLASFQDGLCVAISTSGDPTGSWHQYEFDFTGFGFPDYPKYGFATDAINVMVNLFSPFQGAALGAIDKAEAMSAGPATMVLFTGGLSANLVFGWVPGDNDGPVFDNTPPTFFTNLGGSGDTIYVAEITPDWANPIDSTLAIVAGIPVTPWDSRLCDATRGRCIDQPGSGTGSGLGFIPKLEGIADRMMHRGQTRDFGIRKKALLSHTVDVDGTGKAGVRWYELWNHKDQGWQLKKENTFSPDGDHRWMGSIAMTAGGQTCLGYSISSDTTYPSIGVAGRNGTSNHMNVPELVTFEGENVQRFVARWGDYSDMSVDPVDDSCWYTQEYAKPQALFEAIWGYAEFYGWGTKIMQFTLPDD